MKGLWIVYSAEEMAWLDANRTLPITQYHARFCAVFNRDVAAGNLHALRKRKGWRTGRTGCFTRGEAPHNKGTHFKPPGSERGHFKKGERRGVAVKLYKPVGTERLCKDGYLERKIHDGMPLQSRWRAVHLILWEEINGPIPTGMALKALDSNKANTDPSNWEAVPRAILPRLNGGRHKRTLAYDAAPAELKPAILAIAKLAHLPHPFDGTSRVSVTDRSIGPGTHQESNPQKAPPMTDKPSASPPAVPPLDQTPAYQCANCPSPVACSWVWACRGDQQ